ncbi:interferon alpha-6-like [Sinocyclocheilus grahami]|uniref:interferon alpha-6-like n=1 Tax=Sinocyclocheilus grahami TaxID=75366 RepID=UPI0007ACA726|nr:PREDICTED: interferon alpha-6-like [Sinocyclocheilus grahami]
MALWKCIALMCPFLFFAQICSMPTKCIMRRELLKTTHRLLENMGGLFPRECLKENVEITFPTSALQSNDSHQNTGVAKATYKIMKHIDYLFANDSHPESWNQKKVEDFQNIVYRFTDEYRCIMRRKQRPVDDFPTRGTLKTYFDKLATLLRNKDYSVCAWEVVRKELLHVLKFTLKLTWDSLAHAPPVLLVAKTAK